MIKILIAVIVVLSGRQYSNLAIEYGKNRYIFAFIGVASYFIGIFTGSFLITIVAPGFSDGLSVDKLYGFSIPAGILSSIGIYFLLKRHWSS